MTSRSRSVFLGRLHLKLGGAALALSLGLASCGSSSTTTTTTTPVNTYALTVKFKGVSGPVEVTLTAAGGAPETYNIADGGIISGRKGVYTVSAAAVDKKTTAPQTVDLTSADQTVTFSY